MTYLVLYHKIESVASALRDGNSYDKNLYLLNMESFEDPQKAADFAAKHDGFVVIPASIKSTIVNEQELEK